MQQVDVDKVEDQFLLIPLAEIYSQVAEPITCVRSTDLLACFFVKGPGIRSYGQHKGSTSLAEDLWAELMVYEYLATVPHPNLPTYHGALVEGDRVVGIVLERHKATLDDKMHELSRNEWKDYLEAIEEAVDYLHSLDQAHNDISPANILFDQLGKVTLIDLNSCQPIGHSLKRFGTSDRSEICESHSSRNNDRMALARLRKAMEENSSGGE